MTLGEIAYNAFYGIQKPGGYAGFETLNAFTKQAWQAAARDVMEAQASCAGPSPATKGPQLGEEIVEVAAERSDDPFTVDFNKPQHEGATEQS